jgi:saccharopine dehydrogenase-like NADP-dependent oxidoreductase
MGRVVVEKLVDSGTVTKILVVDKTRAKAKSLARNLSCPEVTVTARAIDVENEEELMRSLRDGDLALGVIGPFYAFEEKLVRASIESGVDYLSICDDYEATQAVLALDGLARKRGVRIVTGLGMTPGITNILAKYAYEKLDRVKRINISWSARVEGSVSEAVIRHTLRSFSGVAPAFLAGGETWVKAGTGMEEKIFPKPIGRAKVWQVGHPEPVTLPRYLTGVREVTIRGGIIPHWISYLIIMGARAHFFDNSRGVDMWMRLPSPLRFLRPGKRKGAILLGIRVDIVGEKGGEEIRYAYSCVESMAKATGISLAVGAEMFLRGDVRVQLGVMAPELTFKPRTFLGELRRRNILIYEGEQMREVMEL